MLWHLWLDSFIITFTMNVLLSVICINTNLNPSTLNDQKHSTKNSLNVLKLYFFPLCVSTVSFSQTRWSICEVAFCPFLAWEHSWGFVGADTLLLCVWLSRLHTEVWEAVCHCGSQHQIERRACDRGTFRLVQRSCRGLRAGGTGKPEPLHIQ